MDPERFGIVQNRVFFGNLMKETRKKTIMIKKLFFLARPT